ncbi:hypothetical protein GF339_17645, partial [candidate division KSB3 bacterium]|nr:hypothetical protein [candidate division KSB3 bacterium]MBD3326413.1 hypothetical protein [candidate division KSB3 bacterium]
MNIQAEQIRGQQHISVMGLLDSPEDQAILIDALHACEDISEIHITFFET